MSIATHMLRELSEALYNEGENLKVVCKTLNDDKEVVVADVAAFWDSGSFYYDEHNHELKINF